ncbi:unnamed protein product, partial [marine sediment metagenome]
MASNYITSEGGFNNTDLDDIFNPLASSNVAENFETGGDLWTGVNQIGHMLAQGFKLSSTLDIVSAALYLKAYTGNPSVKIHIYSSSGGLPDASLTASDSIELSETPSWHLMDFTPVELTSGTLYYVVAEQTAAGTSMIFSDDANGYADGKAVYHQGSSWDDGGGDFDSYFRVYTDLAIPVDPSGIKVEGIDINYRYDPIAVGLPADPVGYLVDGVDLNTIFAALAGAGLGRFGGGSLVGYSTTNVIEQITVATTANATDFG